MPLFLGRDEIGGVDVGADVLKDLTLSKLTASATATADDIASGKTAYVKGSKVTGTLTAKDLTSDATAYSTDLSLNTTAYANGQKLYGALPCKLIGKGIADSGWGGTMYVGNTYTESYFLDNITWDWNEDFQERDILFNPAWSKMGVYLGGGFAITYGIGDDSYTDRGDTIYHLRLLGA